MPQTISKVKDDFEVINQFILFQVINNKTVSVLDSNEIKHFFQARLEYTFPSYPGDKGSKPGFCYIIRNWTLSVSGQNHGLAFTFLKFELTYLSSGHRR